MNETVEFLILKPVQRSNL